VAYGRTLADLDLRSCLNVFVLAVRKQTEPHFVFLPGPDYLVDPGDSLVMIGRERDLGFLENVQGLPVCPVVPH
jgi:K+/H+ antiporter YhaU regulatory subunit KhtT